MDGRQEAIANPFGMDEECRNCPALCATRERVVHGYGDVGADFLFVGEAPDPVADESGVPFDGDDWFWQILVGLGLADWSPDADRPEPENAYVTHLTRCRHPERPPTDEEVETCEPYLNAEIRMINPEILVPVGERALAELGVEYTTTPADELSIEDDHATSIRGRGFELVPMKAPAEQTEDETRAFLSHFSDLMATDYRQTKGRRSR